MNLAVWAQIAERGIHINPWVVEMDRSLRAAFPVRDAVIDAQLLRYVDNIQPVRGPQGQCISPIDLAEIHRSAHAVISARRLSRSQDSCALQQREALLHSLRDTIENQHFGTFRMLLRLGHVESLADGLRVVHVIDSPNCWLCPHAMYEPQIVERMLDRFGFCRYCANSVVRRVRNTTKSPRTSIGQQPHVA